MNKIKIGNFIIIEKNGIRWEGKIIQIINDLLILKLKSGYNIGIKIDKKTKIELLKEEKISKHKPVSFDIKFDKKKFPISILSAGGTIASSIDYRTGAISASYSASQLIASIPELVNFANIKSRKKLEELSESLTPKHWKNNRREVFRE